MICFIGGGLCVLGFVFCWFVGGCWLCVCLFGCDCCLTWGIDLGLECCLLIVCFTVECLVSVSFGCCWLWNVVVVRGYVAWALLV